MVDQAHEMLTVIRERPGKPDPQLNHPGWFRRCRRTGELEWVPAPTMPDRARPAAAAPDDRTAAGPAAPNPTHARG